MNKAFFTIPLILMGILLVFSSTVTAHEGESHDKGMYEEGSGGSSMHEMGSKSEGTAHEYKGEHGGDHSKEYYEKKYGKYDHEKKGMMNEGSGMKDEAMKMKEMEHKRMEEGSKM
ncbi:MAG TPA: hypothetical protein EYP95_06625 [Nitrospinaceae bacterium]|jgi:hypothetical protein|nr:hypothetical protein [Nitrospinaceae bacterium]HIK57794.1 hypothetical protein [Nitrospinaceae bacterium]